MTSEHRPARLAAANDNIKVVRMTPYNGGCSTTSGMVPVSLARVPTVDGPAEHLVAA